MKKVPLMIAVLMFAATLCFATGQGEGAEDGVTLSMYAYNDRADEVEAPNWDVVLSTFQDTHPEITFEIEYGFSEGYHDKLAAKLAAGQVSDITYTWPGARTGALVNSGLMKDLTPKIDELDLWDKFKSGSFNAQNRAGEIVELPSNVAVTHVVYTNTRLLDELGLEYPETLDDLLAQAPVILDAGLIPIAMDNGDGWQMQSCLLSALVEQTGGQDWFLRAMSGDASFADPEFVMALEVIQTLAETDMLSPGVNQASYGIAMSDFVSERAVYTIDGGWRVGNFVTSLSDEQKEYVELNVFPRIPDAMGRSDVTAKIAGAGYGYLDELAGAEEQAAWDWTFFFSGPEGSAIRQEQGVNPAWILPPAADLDPLFQKLDEFINNTPGGFVIDGVMDAEGMGGSLHPLIQQVIFGDITPQEAGEAYEEWVAANDSNRGM